ncbi:META domain-containing protein [Microbacterium resistens]
MSNFVGMWRGSSGEFVDISQDGTFVGFDNCNTVAGTWSLTEHSLEMKFLGGTQKECPDVTVWLTHAETGNLEADDSLKLSNRGGQQLGVLTRQDR